MTFKLFGRSWFMDISRSVNGSYRVMIGTGNTIWRAWSAPKWLRLTR